MQVASIFWPSRKLQKVSDKPNPQQLGAVGGQGRPADLQVGRPIGRPTRPIGPTASTLPRGASLLLLQVGLGCCGWWLPAINRRGVENRTHTHHTYLSSLVHFLLSLQTQWSLGEVQESSSRRSCSRVWYGFISSSLLYYSVVCNRIRLWLPISA